MTSFNGGPGAGAGAREIDAIASGAGDWPLALHHLGLKYFFSCIVFLAGQCFVFVIEAVLVLDDIRRSVFAVARYVFEDVVLWPGVCDRAQV